MTRWNLKLGLFSDGWITTTWGVWRVCSITTTFVLCEYLILFHFHFRFHVIGLSLNTYLLLSVSLHNTFIVPSYITWAFFLYSHSHYFSLYLLPYFTLPTLHSLIFHYNSTLPIDIIAIYTMLITVRSFCSVNFGPLIDCCTTQIEGSLKYHVIEGGDSIDDDSAVSTQHLCVNSPK